MSSQVAAVLLFALYAVNTQWAFRCQRVARGVLLVARDSAAAHQGLFASLVPSSYVASIWIGRLLWIASAFFAWHAWSWYGLGAVAAYGFTVGTLVDTISPWPSHHRLLGLIKRRISSGAAGVEAITLLPTIHQIERQLAAGTHFEKATTGVWLSRAAPLERTTAPLETPANDRETLPGLAQAAYRVLNAYIEVHDNILGVPWYRAIRRVIPIPGVFDRIPYPEHRETLSHLAVDLRAVRDKAQALPARSLTAAEARFGRSLHEYCDALLDSLVRLQRICLSMAEKAEGHPGPSWAEYQRQLAEYEDSCKRYGRAGEILNADFRALKT